MADMTLKVLIEAQNNASAALEEVGASAKSVTDGLRMAGVGLMGAGMAMGAGLTVATSAAATQEAGIMRLRVAMRNVGQDYDAVSETLEEQIDLIQQKTGIADTDQRDSLAMLTRATGSYESGLDMMNLAMDIAAGLGLDMTTATKMVFYAMEGNVGMLRRYGVVIDENAPKEQQMIQLQEQFAGTAEALGGTLYGQTQAFKNNIGDCMEVVGGFIATAVTPLVEWLTKLTQWFKNLSPATQQIITIVLVAAAAFATIGGGIILLIGFIGKLVLAIKAIGAAMMFLSANPIGIIILAIGALIIAILLIWKHFDTIKAALLKAWDVLCAAFGKVKDFFIGVFNAIKDYFVRVFEGWKIIFNTVKDFFIKGWEGACKVFKTAWEGLKGVVVTVGKGIITWALLPIRAFLEVIDKVIKGVKKIPIIGGKIPGIQQASEFVSSALSKIKEYMLFEGGGIALKPIVGVLAEREPELVAPLSKLPELLRRIAGVGPTAPPVTVTIPIELDGRLIAQRILTIAGTSVTLQG